MTYPPDIWQRYGGKKFCLTVFLVLCAIAAIIMQIKVDPEMLNFLKWATGLYMAGNVGRALVSKPDTPSAPSQSVTAEPPKTP